MQNHYYQPIWTLVGAGAKSFPSSGKAMKDVIPPNAEWIKKRVSEFDPENNIVRTEDGEKVLQC